jgi:predicted nucleic acid-binding protein
LTQEILSEIVRNIAKKVPRLQSHFDEAIERLKPEVISLPDNDRLVEVATYVVAKDVHVIAAAIAAKPDYLVTYDHKHLLDVPEVAERSGLRIVTPDVVVAQIRSES